MKKAAHILLRPSLAMALLLGASAVAFADPPARVGRLSYEQGTVSFHTGDQDQWSPAPLNYPVTDGNAFWTEPGSKTEIQVGSSEIRMDQSTELDVIHLDDQSTQLEVPQGVINVHLRYDPLSPVQVMTPEGEVDLTRAGSYHIDAGTPASSHTIFNALEGQGQLKSPTSVVDVFPGESAMLAGNPPVLTMAEANPTAFDDWALARERREVALQSARYVSPEMTGAEDLDDYGQWAPTPDYGTVWYPTTVEVGWAPYRYGHWAFVAPWGWTWVDNAPWGFAPFHYGRWVQVEGRWGWTPGAIAPRPVYAPALVAFIGGAGWSVSISAGGSVPSVGWVPLGPSEVFHPYYPASVNYIRNVNVTNVNRTVINNITTVNNITINQYRNQQAMTVVPSEAFAKGAPIHKAILSVPRDQLANVHMAANISHIEPTPTARTGGLNPTLNHAPEHDAPRPGNEHMAEHFTSTPPTAHNAAMQEPPASQHPETFRPQAQEQHPDMAQKPAAHGAEPEHAVAENASRPAPGPAIHHASVAPAGLQPKADNHARPEDHMKPPEAKPEAAKVEHPVQRTQIKPTPQGWVRAPQPEKHEPPKKDEPKKPEDPKHDHDPHDRPGE